MVEGLYDPLGRGVRAEPPRWRPSVALVTAGLVAAAVLAFGIAVLLRGGDERGEPRAVVPIERAPAAVLPAPPAPPSTASSTAAAPPPVLPVPATSPSSQQGEPRGADVEIQNGVRIVRMRPDPAKPPAVPGTGALAVSPKP